MGHERVDRARTQSGSTPVRLRLGPQLVRRLHRAATGQGQDVESYLLERVGPLLESEGAAENGARSNGRRK
jgi:hypothetical protein